MHKYNNVSILTLFPVLQLRVDLWGPQAEWTPAMLRSDPLALKRALLRGPDCRVWYLGRRICGWPAGGRSRRVPVPPPRGIFHAHLLRGDALDEACEGMEADELLDWKKGRYTDFTRTHLLQRVGPIASTSQAPTRVAATHPRPRTLERSQQRPRTTLGGEGTSTSIPQGPADPSSSSSQALLGRLSCPPDLMAQFWVPPGELLRQFLRVDASLEPVFLLEAATHVSSLFPSETLL